MEAAGGISDSIESIKLFNRESASQSGSSLKSIFEANVSRGSTTSSASSHTAIDDSLLENASVISNSQDNDNPTPSETNLESEFPESSQIGKLHEKMQSKDNWVPANPSSSSGIDPNDIALSEGGIRGLAGTVVRLFLRIFNPERFKLIENARRDNVNVQKRELIKDLKPHITGRIGEIRERSNERANNQETEYHQEFPKLPKGMSLEKLTENAKADKKHKGKEAAQAHLEARAEVQDKTNNEKSAHFTSSDGNAWTGYEVRGEKNDITITEGHIAPTSEIALKSGDDLTNIYVHKGEKGHTTISTGKIDTQRRADQFVAAVKQTIEKDNMPPCIVMHQLNSWTKEDEALENQHNLIGYMNTQLKEELGKNAPVIIHKNICMNGFSENPITGGNEKRKDHANNTTAIAQEMQIFLKKHADHLSIEIGDKNIMELLQEISEETSEDPKGTLKTLAQTLHELSQDEQIQTNERTELKLAAHIVALHTGQTKKLGLRKLGNAQQVGLHLLFDHCIGAATHMNCKSGLDRTGFTRALSRTIEDNYNEKGLEDTYELLAHFDKQARELDATLRAEIHGSSKNLKGIYDSLNDQQRTVFEMQRTIFVELMEVGRPITELSTGKGGFKWNHESLLGRNPHPIPFLPAFLGDENAGLIQLVEFDLSGKRTTFTQEGFTVFQGGGRYRKS